MSKHQFSRSAAFPGWVPVAAQHYIAHTETGAPLREIARSAGCHASTVMRQVRRVEGQRDDPLVDGALKRLSAGAKVRRECNRNMWEHSSMTQTQTAPAPIDLEQDLYRTLSKLSEPSACLAVAADMDKAVVVRDTPDGKTMRTAIVDREVAEALALKDWITCASDGRVARYHVTPAGRVALRDHVASGGDVDDAGSADAEFGGDRRRMSRAEKIRCNLAESPLLVLSRRTDPSGMPFLSAEMVAAGERFREDFELAETDGAFRQDWEAHLVSPDASNTNAPVSNSAAGLARGRVARALTELGPGLGHVALRCLCLMEGLEQTEKDMGWSARSGKIVLRIALDRLCRYYDANQEDWSPLIG